MTQEDARSAREWQVEAQRLEALCAEKEAVLARIKAHVEVWLHDKRLRLMGEILLRDIARIEEEEKGKAGRR